jgi:succinate dehydrogenase/fumarate reductase flavoprotein subunit
MGGIAAGIAGETSLPGFYAAGECAAVSVHGANRLGANSLLDTLVFGRQAGLAASRYCRAHAGSQSTPKIPEAAWQHWWDRLTDIRSRRRGERYGPIRRELRTTMTDNVGTFRDRRRLVQAQNTLGQLVEAYQSATVMDTGPVFNYELLALLETGFLLDLAQTVVAAALVREESRGAHWRTDFPTRDDEHFLKHYVCTWSADGPKLGETPVAITHYPPKPRTY